MERIVEKAFGGRALAFFVQGAPGDINPYARATGDDGPLQLEIAGRELGEVASKTAASIQTEPETNATLDVIEDVVDFRLRWNQEKFQKKLLSEFGPTESANDAAHRGPLLRLPMATLLINKRIALITMPGEPFISFQTNWRDRCPAKDSLFLGYTNGYFGYFPTIRDAAQGGYGASNSSTWVEVGAAERMVDIAVTRTYEMLGRLTDTPVEPVSK